MKNVFNASAIAFALAISTQVTAAEINFSTKINNNAQTLVVFYSQDANNSAFNDVDKQFKNQLSESSLFFHTESRLCRLNKP